MLIKWIKCQVNNSDKISFSKAQEAWRKIKNAEGFLGQLGGWDQHNQNEACILSFWKDSRAYKNFMDHIHDGIFENSNQRNTYVNISVQIYKKKNDINSIDITTILGKGNILRVADCLVKNGFHADFEDKQLEVWNKGMTDAQGMLSGVFSQSINDHDRYLVASIWEDATSHQNYADNNLPFLKKRSAVEDTTLSITGNLIEINPLWTV